MELPILKFLLQKPDISIPAWNFFHTLLHVLKFQLVTLCKPKAAICFILKFHILLWNFLKYSILLCSFPKKFQFQFYFPSLINWYLKTKILYPWPNWKHVALLYSKRRIAVCMLCVSFHWATENRIGIFVFLENFNAEYEIAK